MAFDTVNGLRSMAIAFTRTAYAPRTSMNGPAAGTPVDWLNEYDFQVDEGEQRELCAPDAHRAAQVQVEAADKFGIIMVAPAQITKVTRKTLNRWQERSTSCATSPSISKTTPSVVFYEACNQIPAPTTCKQMVDVKRSGTPTAIAHGHALER